MGCVSPYASVCTRAWPSLVLWAVARQEALAMGDTPNIAARLQALAGANTVALSATTARLVQGVFALEELGAHHFKGVTEPNQSAASSVPWTRTVTRSRPSTPLFPSWWGGTRENRVTATALGAEQRGSGPSRAHQWRGGHWQIDARAGATAARGARGRDLDYVSLFALSHQ